LKQEQEDGLEFDGLSEGVGYSCRRDFDFLALSNCHNLKYTFLHRPSLNEFTTSQHYQRFNNSQPNLQCRETPHLLDIPLRSPTLFVPSMPGLAITIDEPELLPLFACGDEIFNVLRVPATFPARLWRVPAPPLCNNTPESAS